MALIDDYNKVIYWDGVNWQWLPYINFKVKEGSYRYRHKLLELKGSSVVCGREEVINLLEQLGYSLELYPKSILEVKKGLFLYEGVLIDDCSSVRSFVCKAFNISQSSAFRLFRKSITLEEALIKSKSISKNHIPVRFKGMDFDSATSAAKYLGCTVNKLLVVLPFIGKYPEELLDRYLESSYGAFRPVQCSNGLWYVNMKEAAYDLGLSINSVRRYKDSKGVIQLDEYLHSKTSLTIKGVNYESFKDLANHLGVPYHHVKRRFKRFQELNVPLDYLEDWADINNIIPTQDHLGNWFPHKETMLNYYGVTQGTFYNRISRGWSLEETLTGKRTP